MADKQKVLLLGGMGKIGTVLHRHLTDKYEVIVADVKPKEQGFPSSYLQLDARDADALENSFPDGVDVIINLVALPVSSQLVDTETMEKMTDVYLKATYNIYQAAAARQVGKVIFASSNHVTDQYEEGGESSLGREIHSGDYPFSRGLYGVLKLASENIGYTFHLQYGMSVLNIRIGSFREEEAAALKENKRFWKTLLSHQDAVDLFDKAIQAPVNYGTYYGVSDNPGKPWSIENAIEELGYAPARNALDILEERRR